MNPGDKPTRGTVIELCRDNGFHPAFPAQSPSVVERFTADGTWEVPPTREPFFYREAVDAGPAV